MVYETKNRLAKRKVENSQKENRKSLQCLRTTFIWTPNFEIQIWVQVSSKLMKSRENSLFLKRYEYETEANNNQETVSVGCQTQMECEDCACPSDDLVDKNILSVGQP